MSACLTISRFANSRRFLPSSFSGFAIKFCAYLCVAFLVFVPAWASSTEKVLHTFTSGRDGAHPSFGSLVFDNAGNLYGTTIDGGTPKCGPFGRGGCGTVYQLTPNPDGTWKENILYRFPGGADGAEPYAGVIFDAAGNLYGTTAAGGNTQNGGFGDGTVFELSPAMKGWSETVLHTFATQAGDGQSPTAPLTFDTSGNLYGTTYQGLNPCGEGTIFRLTLNPQGGWTENELRCFSGADSDGAYPAAGVIFDDAGNLYTPTYLGGTDGDGTVLELTPSAGNGPRTSFTIFLSTVADPLPMHLWSPTTTETCTAPPELLVPTRMAQCMNSHPQELAGPTP